MNPAPRILLVEDSELDAELVMRALRRGDLEAEWRRVQTEPDFLAALAWNPALVISDFNLPQFSGQRALELLRGRGLAIPFIVVSGALGEEAAVEMMRLGAVDYLLKDRLGRLPAAVEAALAKSRLEAEAAAARAELAESQRMLSTLAGNLPGMAYRRKADSSGAMLYVSEGCRALTGYERAELEGDAAVAYADLIYPEDRVVREQRCETALVSRTSCGNEYRLRTRDGGTRWVADTARGIYLADGSLSHVEGFAQDITDRKSAVEALRQSEELHRSLIEASPDAIVVAEPDGRLVFASHQARRLFGFGAADPVDGVQVFNFISDADRPRALLNLRRILNDRAITSNVYRMQRRDGTPFEGEVNSALLQCPDGRPRGLVVVTRDVTERRRAEAALRESEARFSAVFEANPIGTALTRLDDGLFLDANVAYAKIFGRRREEILGAHSADLDAWVDRGERDRLLGRMQATNAPVSAEVAFRRRNGEEFAAAISLAPIEVDGERIVLGLVADITARKHAETTLRESEERFRQVVETIHEVFWIVDGATGEVSYVSPAFERIWGRPPAEATQAGWLDSVFPEDRPRVEARVAHRGTGAGYDEIYRIQRPDGEVRWVHDRGFPLPAPDGRILRYVGIVEDITERKNLESQFLRAQRMESIGTLASGIAHDLNNILAPLLMVAPLLRQNLASEHDRELLGLVEQGAQRGASIVKQLLTFSRGVRGNRGAVQVRHLLKEIAALMRETFPREITIVDAAAAGLRPIVADVTQLHQVLLNLCVNARDAMPGGGQLELGACNREVTAADRIAFPELPAGDYVELWVRDTGGGIDSALIDRIFEPFFTTKEIGRGTGLGLSTVLGIVKSHDGAVRVESELGRGSRFIVLLPAAPGDPESAHAAAAAAGRRGRNELVLVVDDEESIRSVLRRVLENNGYRVLCAANGQEGLAAYGAHRGQVHLIFTDLMMPTMSGISLIRAVQALDPGLPFIATTGLDDRNRMAELAELGIRDALAKPFDPRDALDLIAGKLEHRTRG